MTKGTKTLKLVSLLISSLVALSGGTSPLYGIYSSALTLQTGFSASESSYFSLAAAIGGTLGGVVAGLLVDQFGPQLATGLAAFFQFTGFYVIHLCYDYRWHRMSLIILGMIHIGFGSSLAYYSTLKASTVNFPHTKGMANAFPISAFGIAPLFYATISAVVFPNDLSSFLLFVALFSGIIILLGTPFVKIFEPEDEGYQIPQHHYSGMMDSNDLESERKNKALQYLLKGHRGSFAEVNLIRSNSTTSMFSVASSLHKTSYSSIEPSPIEIPRSNSSDLAHARNTNWIGSTPPSPQKLKHHQSSLYGSDESVLIEEPAPRESARRSFNAPETVPRHVSTTATTTSLQHLRDLLVNRLYMIHWILNSLFVCASGTFIYWIGFIVKALIDHNSQLETNRSAEAYQALHVSMISISSFIGRIVSGPLGDYFSKSIHINRLWIIVFATALSTMGQGSMLIVNDINTLPVTSILTGLSCGLMYGGLPSVLADLFGTHHFATTWSFLGTGNLPLFLAVSQYFGYYLDSHGTLTDDGSGNMVKICLQGNGCYRNIFILALATDSVLLIGYLALIKISR